MVRSALPALSQLSGDADLRVALAAVDALGEVARVAGAEGPALQRLHAHVDSLLGSGRHEARPFGTSAKLCYDVSAVQGGRVCSTRGRELLGSHAHWHFLRGSGGTGDKMLNLARHVIMPC